MSIPGPRPLRPARRVEGVRSGTGAPRRQRRLPRGRDPCARRGERVREIDIARDRERLRPPGRRRPSRSAGSPALGLARRGPQARPRHRVPDLLARPRPVGRREPLPRRAAQRAADVRPDGGVGGGEARRVRPRRPRDGAVGSLSLAERQLLEVVKVPARPAEGAPPRRADDGARPGGRRAAARARAPSTAGRESASSTSATGCRRCSASPTASPSFATASARGRSTRAGMSEESLVALMIGRPLQLAFPERHDAAGEREVRARRLGPARRALRADRPRGREGRDPRDRRRRGQRAGAVPPRARRDRARRRQRRLQRPRARPPLAARPAPRGRRAAERRPRRASRSSRC